VPDSDDPVEFYLRATPPPLAPEAETEVCRCIERARSRLRRTISGCQVIHAAVAELATHILSASRKVEDIVKIDAFDVRGLETMRGRFAKLSRFPQAYRDTTALIESIPFLDAQWQDFVQRIVRIETDPAVLDDIRDQEQQIKSGEKELLMGNLRQVVTIAVERGQSGFPVMDLIQMGNLGLLHALDSFDYSRGSRFSNYAAWCIRRAVSRWIVTQGSERGMLEGMIRFPGGSSWVN
jgi:DNA-directed RNA polymerase sigma subunit (sigma70/sigma32)